MFLDWSTSFSAVNQDLPENLHDFNFLTVSFPGHSTYIKQLVFQRTRSAPFPSILFPIPCFCSSRAFFYRKCDTQEQFTVKLAFHCLLFQYNFLTWQMKVTPITSCLGNNPSRGSKELLIQCHDSSSLLSAIFCLWYHSGTSEPNLVCTCLRCRFFANYRAKDLV